jgi:bifunctional non-homologous end joining protein LigD
MNEEGSECGTRTPYPEHLMEALHGLDRTGLIFSLQKHHASSLHWDLRLQHDGVLASWAVPKGLPESAADGNRLGIKVEDHDLGYADFHGFIPEGQYGAGKVELEDIGTMDVLRWDDNYIKVRLNGSQFFGVWSLRNTKGKNWIVRASKP